jgi:hypothetical protein
MCMNTFHCGKKKGIKEALIMGILCNVFEKSFTPPPIHANVLLTSLPIHDNDTATNYRHNNIFIYSNK